MQSADDYLKMQGVKYDDLEQNFHISTGLV